MPVHHTQLPGSRGGTVLRNISSMASWTTVPCEEKSRAPAACFCPRYSLFQFQLDLPYCKLVIFPPSREILSPYSHCLQVFIYSFWVDALRFQWDSQTLSIEPTGPVMSFSSIIWYITQFFPHPDSCSFQGENLPCRLLHCTLRTFSWSSAFGFSFLHKGFLESFPSPPHILNYFLPNVLEMFIYTPVFISRPLTHTLLGIHEFCSLPLTWFTMQSSVLHKHPKQGARCSPTC